MDDRDALTNQAGNAAGGVGELPLDSCTISSCTPAQRAAEKARVAALGIYGTASSRLRKELQDREKIREAVEKSGLPAKEINNFNRVFKESKFPSDKKIATLAPPLRDAAYALRTSRAIESYLRETALQNAQVAKRTGTMEKKVAGNDRSNNSLGASGPAGKRNKNAGLQREASEAAGIAKKGKANELYSAPTFFSGQNAESSLPGFLPLGGLPGGFGLARENTAGNEPGQLGEDDKSLVAGMLRDLQADLSQGQDGRWSADKAGRGSGAGGNSDPAAISWQRSLASVSFSTAGADALILDPALHGELSIAAKEISLFSRMHARIRACSERYGLEPR